MRRARIEKIKVPVISAKGRIVFSREPKEIAQPILEAIAYKKRHDDFIACGGTRILKTFSDNVAAQIAEFKQSRKLQMC